MNLKFPFLKIVVIIQGFFLASLLSVSAQSLLDKPVTIAVTRQPLAEVLQQISDQGNFYFSYGSNVIRKDSLVTLSAEKKTVRSLLDQLFAGHIRYKVSANYIILLPAIHTEKQLVISGKLTDNETKLPVDYASVYSRNLLVSSLSDEQGRFRLRLKDPALPQEITISKIGYQDTTLLVINPFQQDTEFFLNPKTIDLEGVVITNTPGYRNFLMNLLVSSRLRMTSQNLGRFFVNLPYQASLTPGLGTHGKMASQIVNKVSLNLIGGYTAGTNGVELAGVFNISKNDVRYVQAAGLFNLVAGKSRGVQLAGFHNAVQDSVYGVQAAGFSNIAGNTMKGIQMAGVWNKADSSFRGIQAAGAVNMARHGGRGIQLAGISSFNRQHFSGIQISGLFNYTRNHFQGFQLAPFNAAGTLKGFQLGIVNRAEHSEGYSLGILNFIKNGQPHFSLSSSDLALFNLGWKTGTRKLYSILSAGLHPSHSHTRFIWGWGLGTDWQWGEKTGLQVEIMQLGIKQHRWTDPQALLRLHTPFNLYLNRQIAFFAGPSLTFLLTEKPDTSSFPDALHRKLMLNDDKTLWIGWLAGISWYYRRNQVY